MFALVHAVSRSVLSSCGVNTTPESASEVFVSKVTQALTSSLCGMVFFIHTHLNNIPCCFVCFGSLIILVEGKEKSLLNRVRAQIQRIAVGHSKRIQFSDIYTDSVPKNQTKKGPKQGSYHFGKCTSDFEKWFYDQFSFRGIDLYSYTPEEARYTVAHYDEAISLAIFLNFILRMVLSMCLDKEPRRSYDKTPEILLLNWWNQDAQCQILYPEEATLGEQEETFVHVLLKDELGSGNKVVLRVDPPTCNELVCPKCLKRHF